MTLNGHLQLSNSKLKNYSCQNETNAKKVGTKKKSPRYKRDMK